MDLNVCSRRVHDGYATIRSRPRSRPRALYRSDSEELLKETAGPYALPIVSANVPLASEKIHQVPRWSDMGKNKLSENYGTLRRSNKKSNEIPNNSKLEKKMILNTFASERQKNCQKNINDNVYDSVPMEINPEVTKTLINSSTGHRDIQNEMDKSLDNRENYYDTVAEENPKNISRTNDIKCRQPIYAIPNIPRAIDQTNENQTKLITDGNYVPSGDLYRTTARYIEDINRNLAEIDKSYEELGYTPITNSGYGIINRVAKSDIHDHEESLYGIRRKRNMAPMLPITSDFGENNDDKQINQNTLELRDTISKMRPNSFGKLPPKLLPRSSSIENTSRHSTGSTSTTTSSTKSTESLYAISESLTNLPNNKITFRSPKNVRKKILPSTKSFDESLSTMEPIVNVIRRNRSTGVDNRTLHTQDQSTTVVTLSRGRILDPEIESDDETRHTCRPRVTGTLRRSRSRVEETRKKIPNGLSRNNDCENGYSERRYDTLPCRKTKVPTPRPLHKSSEDVLDGERNSPRLERSCTSTIDVRNDDAKHENNFTPTDLYPLYLMDATDVILQSHAMKNIQHDHVSNSSASLQRIDRLTNNKFSSLSRTRHNSLESDDDNSIICLAAGGGFATLPRRRNASSSSLPSSSPSNDSGLSCKRHSGTVLEPLYEHAVSNPVKPRGNESTIIPWWELATRKYRHRSCPTLQAHVVSAFEQSLSNMTQRLQQLTATAEKKDSELHELRETIERLRKQSAEATLNNRTSPNGRRHTLGDSDSGTTGCTGYSNHQGSSMARQLSADSVTSLNSLSSACSASSHHKKKGWLRSSFSKAFSRSRKNRHGSVSDVEDCKEGAGGELSAPNSPRLPTAVKHDHSHQNHGQKTTNGQQKSPEHENALSGSKSSSALYKKEEDDEDVDELKKQLREKDMVLTDIRLEALSSAHQLESLKDTVIKMRNEMLNLKQNNERLQRLVTSKSLTSSQSSLPSDPERRFSMTEVASSVAALSNGDHSSTNDHQLEDLGVPEHPPVTTNTRPFCQSTTNEPVVEQDTDGKRINVAVYLGSENNFNFNLISGNNDGMGVGEPPHCIIANVRISNKTTWDSLDSTVRRCFKDYVSRVDPVTNLGLGVECVAAYHLGEASRCTTDSHHPELLPCGYLIGHVKTIYLVLSGYSWLAIDTLIPRSIVQRLVSLLTEHRRVILCGPSGTGKSYLAGKLAHALVDSDAESKDAAAVATFNVDHKSSKELRQYLAHIAERCDSNAADELPRVIILENLQHAASLGELFSGLLGTRHLSCPAIIGTMSQATCSTTNLQLHHNFRWVLCANHMEPVKGFLGRYLRRKLLEHELRDADGTRNAEMAAVVEWLPRVWLHLNKFLETHSSSDVTIGPRLFLSCPMEVAGSQVWFTDLWNYSVIPYLVEAVREGLTLYGRRTSGNGNTDGAWEDPAQFITSSYPWISTHAVHGGSDALLRLRPEDVGYDVVSSGHTSGVGASSVKSLGSAHSDTEGDPLLNMLMRLQEAANYSSPHSNDSDSVTSLDSSHTRHSEELNTSTSSSRGVESAL